MLCVVFKSFLHWCEDIVLCLLPGKCHLIFMFDSDNTALFLQRSGEAIGVGLLIVVAFLSSSSIYLFT